MNLFKTLLYLEVLHGATTIPDSGNSDGFKRSLSLSACFSVIMFHNINQVSYHTDYSG